MFIEFRWGWYGRFFEVGIIGGFNLRVLVFEFFWIIFLSFNSLYFKVNILLGEVIKLFLVEKNFYWDFVGNCIYRCI